MSEIDSAPIPPAPFQQAGEHFVIELPRARALFTTRRGGRSSGPYASLNLGAQTDDDPVAVAANRELVASEVGARLVWGRQVHGSTVSLAGERDSGPQDDEADGRVTASSGLAPMVLTADCMAIAIAGGGAVAMVHAGWRGLAAGVIEEGVRRVRRFGVGGDEPLGAAIGPHARTCCYEVGEEVHDVFGAAGYPEARSGRRLDMAMIATAKLRDAGVEQIHDLRMCTICSDPSLFFSHRRDRGITGRQAGLAWLT